MLICQLLIFEFLGLVILSFGSGEVTPVSTVLSSWTHAWLASAYGGMGTQVSCASRFRPSQLGIRFVFAV